MADPFGIDVCEKERSSISQWEQLAGEQRNQNVQTSQGRTIIRERIVSTESVNEELDDAFGSLEHRR